MKLFIQYKVLGILYKLKLIRNILNDTLILQVILAINLGILVRLSFLWITPLLVIFLCLKRKEVFISLAILSLLYCNFQISQGEAQVKQAVNNNVEISGTIIKKIGNSTISQNLVLSTKQFSSPLLITTAILPVYELGDLIKVEGSVKKIEQLISNSEFSQYINSEGIFIGIKNPSINKIQQTNALSLFTSIKKNLVEIIQENVKEPEASIITEIIFGEGVMSKEAKTGAENLGIISLLNLSGIIFMIISRFVLSFSKFIGRRKANLVAIAVLILSVLIIAPYDYSAVKITLILCFMNIANIFGRKARTIIILLFLTTIMLIINPFISLSLSFWLSNIATIGIFFYSDYFKTNIRYLKLPKAVKRNLTLTLSILITLFPFVFFYFNEVSIFWPIGSFLIIFMTEPIVMLSVLGIFFYIIHLFFIAKSIFLFLNIFLRPFSTLLSSSTNLSLLKTNNPIIVILFYFILLSMILFTEYKLNAKYKKTFKNFAYRNINL